MCFFTNACTKEEEAAKLDPLQIKLNQSAFYLAKNCESQLLDLGIISNSSTDTALVAIQFFINDIKKESALINFDSLRNTSTNDLYDVIRPKVINYPIVYQIPTYSEYGKDKLRFKVSATTNQNSIIEKVVDIHFVNQNEEIEFIKLRGFEVGLDVDPQTCWPNYEGDGLPPNDTYSIHFNHKVITENEGDRTKVSFLTEELHYVSTTTKVVYKAPKLDPLHFYFPLELGLSNSESKITTNSTTSIKELAASMEIPDKLDKKLSFFTTLDAGGNQEENYPGYRILSSKKGERIKGVIRECGQLDIRSKETIMVPDKLQIELLNCSQKYN